MEPQRDSGLEAARRTARELLEAETTGGFPLLRRIPSSSVRRFLDYYADLPEDEAEALREALAAARAVAG